MAKKELRVVLATGGTGGHIFPAQALAEELLARGHTPIIITDKRFDQKYEGILAGIETHKIRSASPSGGALSKIKALFDIAAGVMQAGNKMFDIQPNVVVGFGGYPSFPTMFAACNRNIPTIIHEQNAILGKVNRYLAKSATVVATSFPEVSGMREEDKQKIYFTGNPVRAAIKALHDLPYPTPEENGTLNLLVTGGSLGATVFGEVVPQAIAELPEVLRKRLVITQQCRQNDSEEVQSAYRNAGIEAMVSPFFADMPDRLKAAQLVIARGGASTVTELMVAGRPAILVPYPHHKDQQQMKNAKVLEHAGGGWVFPQDNFSTEPLRALLESLLLKPEQLVTAAANAKSIGKADAAKLLADKVEELAGK